MTSSRMRNSRFELLPLEILSMVADALGLDLVSHVVFSEFRKDFRDYYYEGRGRDFWEPLLRASGLSTTAEEDFDDKGWAELAVTCVRHVETCQHSQCGMARLKENRKLMDESIRDGIGIMDTVRPGSDVPPQLQPGGAYKGIAFKRPSYGFQNSQGDWRIFAFLNETPSDGLLRYGDNLEDHPLIWRTFAVFPVATGLAASRGPSIIVENNESGNVIADILTTIFRMDRRDIPHEHFDQFMEKMEDEHDLVQNPITPRSWSLRSTFDALQSVQDWFVLTRWKGIVEDSLEDDGEGEYYYIEWLFEPQSQSLPGDYKAYSKLVNLEKTALIPI